MARKNAISIKIVKNGLVLKEKKFDDPSAIRIGYMSNIMKTKAPNLSPEA